MGQAVAKLVSLAGPPLIPAPPDFDGIVCSSARLQELRDLLALRNGFYAFGPALHVFPAGSSAGVMDLRSWNAPELWRSAFPDVDPAVTFFAEDAFGEQFALVGDRVCRFAPETGAFSDFAGSLEEWASRIVSDNRQETGWPLAHAWQEANGALGVGRRLRPNIPFVLGGEYRVQSLWASDAVEAMRFCGSLARQIRDLPDGAEVHLVVDHDPNDLAPDHPTQ